MNGKTTVTHVAIGGSLATLILWLVSFYQPELYGTLPTGGEAAIGTILTAAFTYIKETKE